MSYEPERGTRAWDIRPLEPQSQRQHSIGVHVDDRSASVEVIRQAEEARAVRTSRTSLGEGNVSGRSLAGGTFFAHTYFFSSMNRASNGLLAKFSGRCSQGCSEERNSPAFFWNFSVRPFGKVNLKLLSVSITATPGRCWCMGRTVADAYDTEAVCLQLHFV